MSSFFVSEDNNVVVWAIQEGLFPNILEILNTAIGSDKVKALYTLSNITGGKNQDQIRDLLEESLLIDRVLELMNHNDIAIMGEATWVITNAITCSDSMTRVKFT